MKVLIAEARRSLEQALSCVDDAMAALKDSKEPELAELCDEAAADVRYVLSKVKHKERGS